MSDIVSRLNDIWQNDDHERGCAGRNYTCTCGFDERSWETAKQAAADLEKLSGDVVYLQMALDVAREEHTRLQKELDTAREDALEEAARLIEEGFDRLGIAKKQDTCAHGKFGWEDCEQCAARAIRALKDKEVAG